MLDFLQIFCIINIEKWSAGVSNPARMVVRASEGTIPRPMFRHGPKSLPCPKVLSFQGLAVSALYGGDYDRKGLRLFSSLCMASVVLS